MKTLQLVVTVALLMVAPVSAAAPPAVRVDNFGDLLPSGALARIGTIRLRCPGHVSCLAFSADDKLLLFDVESGRLRQKLPCSYACAFAPDNQRLAAGDCDGRIRIWDIKTGKAIRELPAQEEPAQTLLFSPDGKLLVSGGEGTSLLIWDVR